jgi:GNAT superfamily N-acetyltransferase
MEFKTLGKQDTAAIRALAESSWYDTYLPILEEKQLIYMLEVIYSDEALAVQMDEGQRFFGLFVDDALAGFASISPQEDACFKLNKIYLLSAFQGGGRGKALLKFAESAAVESGARSMILNVNRYNKARFFYESQGYEITAEEDVPIGPYWMNDYVLLKSLSGQMG